MLQHNINDAIAKIYLTKIVLYIKKGKLLRSS